MRNTTNFENQTSGFVFAHKASLAAFFLGWKRAWRNGQGKERDEGVGKGEEEGRRLNIGRNGLAYFRQHFSQNLSD